jgi:hypothetical protein
MWEVWLKSDQIAKRFTDRRVSKLKFYFADVEAFHGPVVVVPDIDGDANRYLIVKNHGQ